MERIKEYAIRVRKLWDIKKDEISTNEKERAKDIVNLVLQMFEAGAKEEGNMVFDKLTLNGETAGEKLNFSFTVNGIEYTNDNVSDYPFISKVAEKFDNTEYNPKTLYRVKEYYESMAKMVNGYYISDYTSGNCDADIKEVTFCIE